MFGYNCGPQVIGNKQPAGHQFDMPDLDELNVALRLVGLSLDGPGLERLGLAGIDSLVSYSVHPLPFNFMLI